MRLGVRLNSKMVPGGPALAASAILESGGTPEYNYPGSRYLMSIKEILQMESGLLR